MRASSGDIAGDSRTGGGSPRSAQSTLIAFPPGLAISVTQSSKIDFADQPSSRNVFFHKVRATPRLKQKKK
jgi:hypothetical protein